MNVNANSAYEMKPETVVEMLSLALDQTVADTIAAVESTESIGPFRLISRLGRGGMGEVWLAEDSATGRSVALKCLHPELVYDESAVHRFRTEAKHMAGLSHPHIVHVLHVGEHEKRPYYVTPLYQESLAGMIARCGVVSGKHTMEIARTLADALVYAHGRGITHRDLKPANVLLDDASRAYLCDFGLVRTVFNDSIINVQKKTQEGTIAYMSPATACGQVEDTRCDIYGWGAILYEMLTGRPPYEGPTPNAILEALKSGPPRPILQVNPKASKYLAYVAEGAMARELRERYAEMKDVLQDLDRIRTGKAPIGPRGRKKAERLVVGVVAVAGLLIFGSGAWISKKYFASSMQDGRIDRVVPDEPLTKEISDMKTTTLTKLMAVALATQAVTMKINGEEVAVQQNEGKPTTLIAPYPETFAGAATDKMALQYAVIELARQEGLGYEFKLSQKNVGEVAKRWITPEIRDVPFTKAMDRILLPLGLGYEVNDGKVVLVPKLVTLARPYPVTDPEGPKDKMSLQYAVLLMAQQAALGYDFDESQKRVGQVARRWVQPNFNKVPFADAMEKLLTPLGVTYEVNELKVILAPVK